MNSFNITGRVSKDLELRMTPSGKQVLDISVAITNGKDDTTFLKITTFGKTAENINKYCKKGDTIGAEGIIKNHNWEGKDGVKRYDYSFLASRIEFLNIKKTDGSKEEELPTNENNVVYSEDIQITDDDLPF